MLSDLEKTLKVMCDPNRMRIVKLLQRRKLCVCELAFVLGIKQPSVSRHLRKLKSIGLIKEEQDSFWTNYVLCIHPDARFARMLTQLSAMLEGDALIAADVKKLRLANRTKLCCR